MLESLGAKWANYGGGWIVRLTKKTPELFVAWLQSLPPDITVQLDRELATLRDAPFSGSVPLDVQEAGIDWFDLKVVLNVSDTRSRRRKSSCCSTRAAVTCAWARKAGGGLQFDLTPEDDERLARLGLNPRDFSAEPQRLHALQLADDAAQKFLPEQQVEQIQRRAANSRPASRPPCRRPSPPSCAPIRSKAFISWPT